MKVRPLSAIVAGLTLTLGTFAFPSLSTASSKDYVCAQLNSVWTTWVRTPRGGMSPLVRWKNDKIQGWTPRDRCIAVSKRMTRLADNGLFNHISGGTVNRQPVLCGVRSPGESCNSRNTILTLLPGSNPNTAANQLLDISGRARGQVLELSGNGNESLQTYVNGQTYINMNLFKQVLEEVETSVSPSQLTPVE
ncbi:MAG: COP23 domain-containing protein [Crocosphaera sp.]|uniref:Uncharacterized protein n=3 Tax=Crocosphaera watsonii TaxID=263511 RepID=T2JQN8_CROWT|nr:MULTISPECIES: COP23 domain-containing protein [Crocosphaera]EHJ09399.1 hypothetical protein CWATWH0003_B174 [Crocosphaera watsonii WH 0003]MCH2247790.1 COP23 domain-containing protein [Crocosphaera sp.]CCQ55310.1 hypothetical protein CWATWH0005_5270 [Crocosphaera watsonii WH 0005]CCQ68183.1 hypothetical protein CWATWH0402_5624 [Crocosphaera watsonii WH 0402]